MAFELQTSSSDMDSLHRSKRQKLDHFELGFVQKSRCDPCEQDFTTYRAYLRHVRENRRHRSEGTDGERDYGCPFCSKTFAQRLLLEHTTVTGISRSSMLMARCCALGVVNAFGTTLRIIMQLVRHATGTLPRGRM